MNGHTLIGLVAGICTTLSFFPQLVQTIRTKRTKDISLGMYTLITVGLLIWLIYGIMIRDLPIILANAVSFAATMVILAYKIRYR